MHRCLFYSGTVEPYCFCAVFLRIFVANSVFFSFTNFGIVSFTSCLCVSTALTFHSSSTIVLLRSKAAIFSKSSEIPWTRGWATSGYHLSRIYTCAPCPLLLQMLPIFALCSFFSDYSIQHLKKALNCFRTWMFSTTNVSVWPVSEFTHFPSTAPGVASMVSILERIGMGASSCKWKLDLTTTFLKRVGLALA